MKKNKKDTMKKSTLNSNTNNKSKLLNGNTSNLLLSTRKFN